jgi:5-methylcytosine-specific restriction endonuclease McrA
MPSEGWKNGSTRAWRKIRAQILRRDAYICQLKIVGVCTYKATCVHHLDGKALGDNPERCVASCTPCNLHIGDPTGNDPGHRPRTNW